MAKKLLIFVLMALCFGYILAANKCSCEPTTVHAQNCDWVPGISCRFNVADAQKLLQNIDSAEMQISIPSWLGVTNPSNQILFAASSKDLEDKPVGTVKITPIIGFHSGSVMVSMLVVSPELKKTFQTFLDRVKPGEDVAFQVSLEFETLNLKSVTNDVYNPFDVTTTLSLGGSPQYEYIFKTSMSKLFADYLSSAIDQIPDTAFDKNPDQRRNVLHNNLDAAINAFNAHNPKGAYQQITHDIIPKIHDWVVDPAYEQSTAGAFGKVATFMEPLI